MRLPVNALDVAMLSASGCAKAVTSVLVALLMSSIYTKNLIKNDLYSLQCTHNCLDFICIWSELQTQKYRTMLSAMTPCYLPRKMLSATRSHKLLLLTSQGSNPIISLALEKLWVLHDLHIPRFLFLNMQTIFCTLLAIVGHQKHKSAGFRPVMLP